MIYRPHMLQKQSVRSMSVFPAPPAPVQPETVQPAAADDEPVTDYIAFLGSKGINTTDALGYCMNSDDLYKELIESFCTGYAEKAAEIYMKIAHLPRVNTITDEQMHLLEKRFHIKAREGYLS